MKHSKRYQSGLEKIDRKRQHTISEGVGILKSLPSAKFNETVDIAVKLGVDPKKSDQMVRGTVTLPYGTGKEVRVLVLCKAPKDKEALEAGADMAGLEEYIEKIESGWSDVDAVVATPDVMKDVGKLGKYLGRKGLMPNPKTGTVTFEVAEAVKQLKAGRIEFRVDKFGNVHSTVGKMSFEQQKLEDNIKTLLEQIIRLKPAAVKGQYFRGATISSTMSPGIHLDRASIMDALR